MDNNDYKDFFLAKANYNPEYSPVANISMFDSKPNEEMERVVSNPVYEALRAIGIPKNIPGSNQEKYSPISNIIMGLSGIKKDDIDERLALSMLGDMGIYKGSKLAGEGFDFLKSSKALDKLSAYAKTIIPQEYLKTGSFEKSLPSFTDRLLELREMAGSVSHPSLTSKASMVVHDFSNELQSGLAKEIVRKIKAKKSAEMMINKADELSKKVEEGIRILPEVFGKNRKIQDPVAARILGEL
jgi:hypothetical protein